MRPWACRCLAWSLGLAVLGAAAAETEDQGQIWLTRMMESGASLDYQGTFVYARGGALEAMRILNRINGGEASQHMVALTGMPRELIRENQTLTLMFPGHTKIMQADGYHAPPFPLSISGDLADLARLYGFELQGADRIAGRESQRLDLRPLDRYRFGHALWLDRETGVLLRYQLRGVEGEVLEQLMFTEFSPGTAPAEAPANPNPVDASVSAPERRVVPEKAQRWFAATLPPGFAKVGHWVNAQADQGGGEHMMFSDGLASVSVYVKPLTEGEAPMQGNDRIGALSSLASERSGHQIVVLGEVPMAAIELIAESLEYRDAPDG
jgi:sigma-E factor negative regulatory protein RseB